MSYNYISIRLDCSKSKSSPGNVFTNAKALISPADIDVSSLVIYSLSGDPLI